MIKKLYVFLSVVLLLLLCSNISQPGIYNAGGTSFSMLFPDDSLSYKKVQMQSEAIFTKLYKGFAVVKGTYKMVNTSTDSLKFTMGYPVNGIFNGGEVNLNQVQLDSLYKFKIKTNGKEQIINQQTIGDSNQTQTFQNDNWFTWEITFSPKESKDVEVYFLVNTYKAGITKGYSNERKNAFIYLLESGSVWKQPIEKGKFIIELKDNLKLEDVSGISSHFNFRTDVTEKILVGAKTNFSPTPKDNLIITYFKHQPDFHFELKLHQSEKLFEEIEAFSKQNLPQKLKPYKAKNPYEVQPYFWSFLPGVLIFVAIASPFILVLFLIIVIYKIFNKKSIKKCQ
jgi:hypothetical protein